MYQKDRKKGFTRQYTTHTFTTGIAIMKKSLCKIWFSMKDRKKILLHKKEFLLASPPLISFIYFFNETLV